MLGPGTEVQQPAGLTGSSLHRPPTVAEGMLSVVVGGSVAFGNNDELGERRELSSYPGSVTGLLYDLGQITLFICLSNVGCRN